MVLYSSLVGAVDGNRIHVEFLRIPKPSGFSYRISIKVVYGNYPFFERGEKYVIILTSLLPWLMLGISLRIAVNMRRNRILVIILIGIL